MVYVDKNTTVYQSTQCNHVISDFILTQNKYLKHITTLLYQHTIYLQDLQSEYPCQLSCLLIL